MHQHYGDHEVRAPVVHRPQKPSKLLVIVEILETCVRIVGRRHIHEGQAYTGNNLQNKTQQGTAAEYVEPAFGISWDRVSGGRRVNLAQMGAIVNPKRDLS